MALQHLRSSIANKRPLAAGMADGQLAMNTNTASPGLFFKDSTGALVKVGPVHVGTTAPNASPASGGGTGNTVGEQWLDTTGGTYVFKVWDGTGWRSETGTFVDAAGDVMTGALGIIAGTAAAPGLYVSGDTNTGLYSPGADQLALATGGSARMTIAADGTVNVTGALTKSGSNVVTVADTGTVTSAMVADGTLVNADINASAAIAGTKISPDFGSQNAVTTGTSTAGAFIPTSSTAPTNGVYLPSANSVALATAGTGRVFVDATGKVGIGVVPARDLTVYGGSAGLSYLQLAHSTASGASRGFEVVLNSTESYFINRESGPTIFSNGGSERLRLTSDGKLGLGVSAPRSRLDVRQSADSTFTGFTIGASGSDKYIGIGYNSATTSWNIHPTYDSTGGYSPLAFNVGGSEALRIDTSQRVGIGTSAPSEALTVAGNIRANGTNPRIGAFGDNGTSPSFALGNSAGTIHYVLYETLDFSGNRGSLNIYDNVAASSRLVIDSSGRLLVGTSSESGNALQVVRGNVGSATGAGVIDVGLGTTRPGAAGTPLGYIRFTSTSNTGSNYHYASIAAETDGTSSSATDIPGRLVFSTTPSGSSSPVERMKIDNSGVVNIGSGNGLLLQLNNSGGYNGCHSLDNTAYTIGQNSDYRSFRIGSGSNWLTTGVNLAAGGTSWGTYSDERLKKDISELTGCLEKLSNIRCVTYRLKDVDAEDSKKRIGVIAQDLQGKFNEALNASKRSEDDSAEYLSVQYTDLVPVLIKALQESKERIETLEARVAALEGA